MANIDLSTTERFLAAWPGMRRRLQESAFFLLTPTSLYLLISFLTFNAADPGWSNSGGDGSIKNLGGSFGAWLADFSLYFFGYMAYIFPLVIAWYGWQLFRDRGHEAPRLASETAIRLTGFVLCLGTASGLAHLHSAASSPSLPLTGGGIVGEMIGMGLFGTVGYMGATLFMMALFFSGLTLFMEISWLQLMDKIGRGTLNTIESTRDAWHWFQDWRLGKVARSEREHVRKIDQVQLASQPAPRIEHFVPEVETSTRVDMERQSRLFDALPAGDLPPLDLLEDPPPGFSGYSDETLEALSRQVELKLADFNVSVKVVAVLPGPVITRFELDPAPGVKGAQVANLAKDLARGLSVISVRVVDVIPGKSVIGLEIPNLKREIVYLSEILRSKAFDQSSSPLSLALGKDISGQARVVDIGKMPHVLVAGTTGSGKSVAINAMVLSLLYKATAEQVRLIMIDPKMLELSVYEGIPHLLTPVVTDMKDAANALRWCVGEMERRYQVMSAVGVRNLAGFNKKVSLAAKNNNPIKDPLFVLSPMEMAEEAPDLVELPNIVVVIDEFADLMMIVGKKIEELIARLAQKARAAGIHLILATQRPSVDVITGLIKANIPTRIAFQVSSKVDSRTILDQMGAEQLLGHGDMLYLPPGTGLPERIHGAYVADDEVHAVVKYLRKHFDTSYHDGVTNETQTMVNGQNIGSTGLPQSDADELDELYDQAVAIVTKTRRASISNIQRRLKVGYNRAARMVEEMEAAGVVSPPEHNGNREVLAPPPPED